MTISFARHEFPPAVIRHAVWLYARFTLSYRDVEDLLAERGLDVSYETVRLANAGQWRAVVGNVAISLAAGLAAVALGWWVGSL